jgi:hypothetical protein
MEIRVPHQFTYNTKEDTPIADVVASLLAAERLLFEVKPLLESCIPGLRIEKISVSIREITQQSPLRELLFGTFFIAFQKDLERDVPEIVNRLMGVEMPHQYDSIVTLVFCLILFYGLDFVYHQVNKGAFSHRIRGHFEGLAKEVAKELNISEERIRTVLEEKYGASKLRLISGSAIRFFMPSKRQANAAVLIGRQNIDSETVADIPSDAQIETADEPEMIRSIENVEIELHAQDVDRSRQGWAAVINEITPKRMRMEIYPPIKPEDLYTKTRIRGDIMLVSQQSESGVYEPHMFHLIRIRDS